MSMPIEKVEVGFEISPSGAVVFTLDDDIRGLLDNDDYRLGGAALQFLDVTSQVKSFSISRGRSSLFANFPAGQLNVVFNNQDRAFDPLYDDSPYAGNIVPRREIRIRSNNELQYTGWIDDWGYSYLPNGDSTAEAIAYDATSILSGQTLSLGTPTAQKTGARIEEILDEVDWDADARAIDTGLADLGNQVISDGTNAFDYLQQIASSEPGLLFIDKEGSVKFAQADAGIDPATYFVFGGTGIPFQNLEVSYGSDNLYNEVVIAREGGGTATATDPSSIAAYGKRVLSAPSVLLANDTDLADLALLLVEKYSLPEYRFSSLEVALHKLETADQNKVLGLELGSIAKVEFTPNDIGDAIERFVKVISINHLVRPDTHYVEFGFEALEGGFWTLSDEVFGRLSSGNFLGF
jgi:hypothetical protein